ncbi:DUF1835 domain-containing protein [Capnocytophaga sp. H4358]|uniref:DUF1835 domain-containing protein n=1 Tax=Capnocytophaga sp. H4358 TaxID=1945658 RepID=UPI000BB199A9|nr:DUF1835 domain-containing protein [Capnocytophaga sp. H4358]ATA73197.1 DUF1835 domain-containing protein [Capnocytophaga sp. H4358]
MKRVLHITNNQSASEKLQQTYAKSEVITWNEMLCEGKTTTDVGSEHFWKNRYDFFKNEYNTEKSSFIETVLKEYRNLCNQKTQDEIVLWFAEDLQSQFNMIGVISWIKQHRKNIQVSWVNLLPSSQTIEKIKLAYTQRHPLIQDDIEYADYIWQLYCSNSPLQLEKHTKNIQTRLTALPNAIQLHLKRFPLVANGLNNVEINVLETIYQLNGNRDAVLSHLVKNDQKMGYASAQYQNLINRLRPLLSSLNPLKINEDAEKALRQELNVYASLRNEHDYFGGSLKYNFLYYEPANKIMKL